MESQADGASQVRIVLETNDPDVQLRENTGAILVSTALRRYALSTLVNNLLERTEKPIPFEFLVNGRFLRSSIDDYLTANGISSEVTLYLEYVKATNPPVHVISFEHDDWVSSVDVLTTSIAATWQGKGDESIKTGDAKILSGCYDGIVRVWSSSSELLAQSSALSYPAQAIKSVKFLSSSRIATGGNDRCIRIWKYDYKNSHHPDAGPGSVVPSLELFGHEASVDSISVHVPSSRILSASSDHTVGIFSTKISDAPPAPESLLPGAASQSANKRRKLNAKSNVPQRGPLSQLKSHTAPVTAASFSARDPTVGNSTSWDHNLNTWDLVTEQLVSNRHTLHPLLCLAELKDLGLLVVGTSARHLFAADPRVDAKSVAGLTLRGHTGPVVSAAAEASGAARPWGLVSGSLDGTCRVWDVRSIRSDGTDSAVAVAVKQGRVCESTYTLKRESLGVNDKKVIAGDGIKVFGVCWDKELGIVSCGEDRRVQVNQSVDLA